MPMSTLYRPTFVSHAHADNELCDRYVAALRARGIDVWYDRTNLQVGHSLTADIEVELRKRSTFVVIATPASLASQWVRSEIAAFRSLAAHDTTRLFVPVRAAPCEMPLLWADILWIDAVSLGFDAAIDALAAALAQPDAATAPAPTPQPVPATPSLPAHPGPAPTPAGATPAHHLTPMSLYNLGFRGYSIGGVECILPPICPVPGGIFAMGSDKAQDEQAYPDETPQYPVQVDDFSIGQHPVTVAEYACAVRANADLGMPYWWLQLRTPEHPVVGIAWQRAGEYTQWLASVTGQLWRLPTEAEWEKAARWDAQAGIARIYPWGDTFDADKCNTRFINVQPVGSYPAGVSPYGAHDMAGNIWEWTSSLYKPYSHIKIDEFRENNGDEVPDEERVLRGGSGDSDPWYVRAAYRNHNRPDLSYHLYGFRLALSPARADS